MDRMIEKYLKDNPTEAYSIEEIATALVGVSAATLANLAKSVIVLVAVQSSLRQLAADGSVDAKTVNGTTYYRAVMGKLR